MAVHRVLVASKRTGESEVYYFHGLDEALDFIDQLPNTKNGLLFTTAGAPGQGSEGRVRTPYFLATIFILQLVWVVCCTALLYSVRLLSDGSFLQPGDALLTTSALTAAIVIVPALALSLFLTFGQAQSVYLLPASLRINGIFTE